MIASISDIPQEEIPEEEEAIEEDEPKEDSSNEDLAREYKAIIQYIVFSSTLKGAEYSDIADQLKKHASQELAHALEVARQIDYLGGDPTMKGKESEYSEDPKKILEIDLQAEQETIKNYREKFARLKGQANLLSLKR